LSSIKGSTSTRLEWRPPVVCSDPTPGFLPQALNWPIFVLHFGFNMCKTPEQSLGADFTSPVREAWAAVCGLVSEPRDVMLLIGSTLAPSSRRTRREQEYRDATPLRQRPRSPQPRRRPAWTVTPALTVRAATITVTTTVDENDNDIGTSLYTASTMHCMAVSPAQGGEGLGTMWGEEKTRPYLRRAGFRSLETNQPAHDFAINWYVVRS